MKHSDLLVGVVFTYVYGGNGVLGQPPLLRTYDLPYHHNTANVVLIATKRPPMVVHPLTSRKGCYVLTRRPNYSRSVGGLVRHFHRVSH